MILLTLFLLALCMEEQLLLACVSKVMPFIDEQPVLFMFNSEWVQASCLNIIQILTCLLVLTKFRFWLVFLSWRNSDSDLSSCLHVIQICCVYREQTNILDSLYSFAGVRVHLRPDVIRRDRGDVKIQLLTNRPTCSCENQCLSRILLTGKRLFI